MPFLAATLLALKIPDHFNHLTYYALFSMFPLLCRDKLLLPYLTLHLLFTLIYHSPGTHITLPKTKASPFFFTSFPGYSFLLRTHFFISLVLHVVYLTVQPPQKYPFLFEALIMILCFSYFVMFAIYTNYTQWNISSHFRSADKDKKQIWRLEDRTLESGCLNLLHFYCLFGLIRTEFRVCLLNQVESR